MSVVRTLAVLWVLLTTSWANAAVEARCTALGADCDCSEPLNTNSGTNGDNFDPPDSATQECAGGPAIKTSDTVTAVPAFGMPSGSTVNWVLKMNNTQSFGVTASMDGNLHSFATGTLCTRIYQTFSADFPEIATATRAKLMEYDVGSNQVQTEWYESSSSRYVTALNGFFGYNASVGWFGTPDAGTQTGPIVHLADCKTSWCRTEQCLDISGGVVTPRTRIVVVNNPTLTETLTGTAVAGSAALSTLRIGNLYRQSGGSQLPGNRYVSHGIETFSGTMDHTFWPGAATEFNEGGGASSFDVVATCTPTSGPVPLAGVACSGNLGSEGTGPDYVFTLDCNSDGVVEQTVGVDDDATPVATVNFATTACDTIYATASPGSNGYTATVTVKDCANTTSAACVPVATTSGSTTVTVLGNQSICPVGAQSGVIGVKLWNATTDQVLDDNFQSGDHVLVGNKACVAFEAMPNPYLDPNSGGYSGGPGSVEFKLDGTVLNCEGGWQYTHPPDDGFNDVHCSTSAVTVAGAHTLVVTPYDADSCTGALVGTALTIPFTTD